MMVKLEDIMSMGNPKLETTLRPATLQDCTAVGLQSFSGVLVYVRLITSPFRLLL
jgi:hypothetical protein